MPALLELIKKSSHLSNQEVPYKQILNSFNDIFCLTADGKTLAQPQQLIGSARSHEIIINTGLPISKIFVCTGKFKELETGLNALFQTGKSTSDHKLLRFIKHYIFGPQEEILRVLTFRKTKTVVDAGISGFLHPERE
jgi:hypothetical protein